MLQVDKSSTIGGDSLYTRALEPYHLRQGNSHVFQSLSRDLSNLTATSQVQKMENIEQYL